MCHAPLRWPLSVSVSVCERVCQVAPWVGFVELFAGIASITAGFASFSVPTIPLDIQYNPVLHDLLSNVGYAFCLGLILRVRPGGAIWVAPTCSSWLWCARSRTHRSFLTPLGAASTEGVADSNVLVSRSSPEFNSLC